MTICFSFIYHEKIFSLVFLNNLPPFWKLIEVFIGIACLFLLGTWTLLKTETLSLSLIRPIA